MGRNLVLAEKNESMFFSPQKIGESFREVDVNYADSRGEKVVTRWFHADEGSDLYIWIDPRGEIVKQQIALHGLTIEWNILDGLRTGIVLEEELLESTQRSSVKPSVRVIWDKVYSPTAVSIGVAVLGHITILEPLFCQKLQNNFKSPSSISRMAPDEVVRRFGNVPSNTPIWKKIRNLLRKALS